MITKGMGKTLIAVAGGISRHGEESFYRSCVTGEKTSVPILNALRERGLIAWVSTKYAFASFREILLTDAGEKLFRELRQDGFRQHTVCGMPRRTAPLHTA